MVFSIHEYSVCVHMDGGGGGRVVLLESAEHIIGPFCCEIFRYNQSIMELLYRRNNSLGVI